MKMHLLNALVFFTVLLNFAGCGATQQQSTKSPSDNVAHGNHADKSQAHQANKLIYLNETQLVVAKQKLNANNPIYVQAYKELSKLANKELKKKVDPVTNKTMIADSGDIHDYHTLGAYYWPDKSKPDGLPWIYKDGEFNRVNLSPATDWKRRKDMLNALGILNLAFYHSNDMRYLTKAKEIVYTWFVNPKTKMNPNLDYAKAIPGKVSGTNFGVISWTDIGKVVTTIQLLERNKMWQGQNQAQMQQWLHEYYTWLTTSEFGIRESTRTNNHGTNYDYQAIGLMLYLGKITEAKARIEQAKTLRIAAQIADDGSQPLELKRTKSVSYTINNLWALVRIADLAKRHTDIDLWSYASDKGASLQKGFEFVVPYMTNHKKWQWKQITGGGVKANLTKFAIPMFKRAQLMLGVTILPSELSQQAKLNAQDILTYAP
ncbi:hypothetical protein C2869_03025 [Saccharobesus litoralis]|uniref:Alginate lyase domain-containing protein n=1 Tax=Saccharobesus litoralis TaxID=2172099 RepID=A0A2S0VN05_9ALTE|nr:alginate lyase family protein [Saccharobesus litoralis]AWB65470.1 hypothetical protein C2869_03025 [Saccharobesus litoralis]